MDATKALEFIIREAPNYAKAKANRQHIEEYRKVLKAELFSASPDGTVQAKENYAYSHEDYKKLLEGYREAIEVEQELLWRMKAAEHKIECWRTEQANARFIDKGTA